MGEESTRKIWKCHEKDYFNEYKHAAAPGRGSSIRWLSEIKINLDIPKKRVIFVCNQKRKIMTSAEINSMSIREINKYFRSIDESDKFPICGKFNVTERAIRKLRKFRREIEECYDGMEYYDMLESTIRNIVNNEKNW